MNKKVIISLVLAILLIVVVGGFLIYIRNSAKAFEMSGGIIKIKQNTIIVSGPVKISGEDKVEDKNIEVLITPQTVLKKTVLYIEKKNIVQSGVSEPFTPIVEQEPGKIEDLKINTRINHLKSSRNLLGFAKAMATEIEYQTIEYEK